jgi:hypothetical protein
MTDDTTRRACAVHSKHIPEPHTLDHYYVWPLDKGGPDSEANLVRVCPTGAANIRTLLSHHLLANGQVPYSVRRQFSHHERDLAKLGFDRIMRQAM